MICHPNSAEIRYGEREHELTVRLRLLDRLRNSGGHCRRNCTGSRWCPILIPTASILSPSPGMEPAIRSRFSLDVPWENPSANEKRLLRQLLQVIYDSSLKLPSGERLSFLQECTQKIEDVLVSLSMETKEDDEIIDQHNSSEGTPDPQTNIITPDAMNLSAKTSCIIKEVSHIGTSCTIHPKRCDFVRML